MIHSVDLLVAPEVATHRLTFWIDRSANWIDREDVGRASMDKDSYTYWFASANDAQTFRELERIHTGSPYTYGYVITASEIGAVDLAESHEPGLDEQGDGVTS